MSATFLTLIGAKGGTGTSTICAELAKALRDANVNVTLVDGDLSGRRSSAILFDAVRYVDAAHDEHGRIASARVNGVTLVELAQSYDSAYTLDAEDVEVAAAALEEGAGFVLVDLPLPFAAMVRPLVARTTRFLIVTEATVLGVTATRTMVTQLRHFGVPDARIAVVLNNRSADATVSRGEVERIVGVAAIADLPALTDRGFARAISAFQREVRSIHPEPRLEILAPSETGQIRDRRKQSAEAKPSNSRSLIFLNNRRDSGNGAPLSTTDVLKAQVHDALAKNVDLLDASRAQGDTAKLAELRARISDITQDILSRSEFAQNAETIAHIKEEIIAEALGLGPIEEFMHDPGVTEIMVNGPADIYIEREGLIQRTAKRFPNETQLRIIIERILTPLGRRLDESVPMVDARLPDGSRVNVIIEPLSLIGPTLTIRRFGTRRLRAEDLLEKGSVNEQMFDFLRACIEARLNVVISGGTGSGKTTFLNILSSFLPERERIVTIEDAAELRLNQPHVIPLESRPENLEGRGQVTIRDLVRNSLRMRPDRIVVGECRGAEALDMLQAMNTGHDGSLTTIHANSARDALSRIETMVLMAGFDLPVRAIREQVASAIDVVIQTARLRDGSRKVTGISEVVGMEGDTVTMQEIVRFSQHGVDENRRVIGEFQYSGVQPKALKRFSEYGVMYDHRPLSKLKLATVGASW